MIFNSILRKIFGSKNDRELKKIRPLVSQINALEPEIQKLSDTDLQQKTIQFRERIQKGEPLDSLLPEAFAVVREASRRVLGMRHFDSQLIGGLTLHTGKISEMKTGEGKTLVATLPVYLNALEGRGVHVVTVNDYLAKRDSEWMGRLYQFLGLTTGVIVHGLNDAQRRAAYHADVTYGTNNEYGFDYLRDHMKFDLAQCVQRELNYAIVDEVDSILIDEARTPLIISGPSEESTDKYYRYDRVIPHLKKDEDYTIDEKSRTSVLIEAGVAHVEKILGIENLYDPTQMETLHHINQALRAYVLFRRDVDYVVKDGEVIIVDEFTGRLMPGRRWSDGLHQAIEAKEKVNVESENQTLATISFQNYFRMYKKLAGMTGTADTEAAEFGKIYSLDVMVIPTNRAMVRKDLPDMIYKNEKGKFRAVVKEIEENHQKGQPVLVGTISIEKSEVLADMLARRGVKHHVLNAKQHEREAEIVAQAGRYGAVTISTNMAGRGTDILLGGNPEFLARAKVGKEATPEDYQKALQEFQKSCEEEKKKVVEAGGLHIIGTERHESRRIDNQLRGRAGRQGDPGSSRFYISLEDDLMRIFGSDRIKGMMEKLGMEEDEPIFHPWISKRIEKAQQTVEGHNFGLRKNLLEFDDVMNQQRKTVYQVRREILAGTEIREKIIDMIDRISEKVIGRFTSEKDQEQDMKALNDQVFQYFAFRINDLPVASQTTEEELGQKIFDEAIRVYEEKEKRVTPEILHHVERILLLQTLDTLWKDHLLSMDHLREGIGLRGYAQKDPIVEYKREGYALFEGMMESFAEDVVEKVFRVQIQVEVNRPTPPISTETLPALSPSSEPSFSKAPEAPIPVRSAVLPDMAHLEKRRAAQPITLQHASSPSERPAQGRRQDPRPTGSVKREAPKVGRNDPCPCGSGKKYKKCHGE